MRYCWWIGRRRVNKKFYEKEGFMRGHLAGFLNKAGGFLLCSGMFFGCHSASVENRLRALEVKQDSLLSLLKSMQEKNEFMAVRMGWKPPADNIPKVLPVGKSFSRGPENAALTIVEFSDLQCPYCAQVAPILDSVSKVYPKDVRLVFKHFPLSFHPQARAAAAAAIAAGKQGKFFEFRFEAADHFRNLGDSLYIAVARKLGLNVERFKQDMSLTPEVNQILEEDMALGRKVGVEGTPTIFVNGRLAADRSFEYYASLIEQAKSSH